MKSKAILFVFFGIFLISMIDNITKSPEILALCIPIVAIFCFSPIGKAIATSISGKTTYSGDSYREIDELKNKYNNLEYKLAETQREMDKLRESVVFYDSKKIKSNNISLEKN